MQYDFLISKFDKSLGDIEDIIKGLKKIGLDVEPLIKEKENLEKIYDNYDLMLKKYKSIINDSNERIQDILSKRNAKRKDNLIMAVAECDNETLRKSFFNKITELENESNVIERELYIEESKQLKITVKQITYFLREMRNGSENSIRYKKMLIDCFVNAIYLYDDKFIAILNIDTKPKEIEMPLLNNIECSLMGRNAPP